MPARSSSAASCCTRAVTAPDGSPTISVLPKRWCTKPGPFSEQLACTTQPITWAAGMAWAISPVASTACSRVPA